MKNLAVRNTEKEILDNLSCFGEPVRQNLKELDIINTVLGGNSVSSDALKKVVARSAQNSWKIADIGCGSGQLMREMNNALAQKKCTGIFTGFDANPFIVDYANDHCKAEENIAIKTLDVISDAFPEHYDIVHASLFLHHFTEKELIILLKKISAHTNKAIIINDLHRHPLAYYSIKLLTNLFSKSHMVKHDAALSVAKGFTQKEWRAIFVKAGFTTWTMKWVWAFRHQIILYPIAKT